LGDQLTGTTACAASSTDRCNTFCELLSRRLIEQGLSGLDTALIMAADAISCYIEGLLDRIEFKQKTAYALDAIHGRLRWPAS
jgi:hypothetical protein